MIILGIDPGTARAGYGVINTANNNLSLVAAGILEVPADGDKAGVLEEIRRGIERLCAEHRPDLLAIEKLYFSKNRKTALAVAESRGVILLTARSMGLAIREYSPTEVKAGLTGYGGADKKSVLKMVRLVLNSPGLALIDDASDALALALVASQDIKSRQPRDVSGAS